MKEAPDRDTRLAVMIAIAVVMILRDAKVDHHPIDTVANDLAKAARIVADALIKEAGK
ncbi:MAG TPA: hypothetical protein VGE96_00960 [Steroidobacteraceae bacterium]|jgi:hypothetical protein